MEPLGLEEAVGSSREEVVQSYLTEHPQVLTTSFGLPRVWAEGGPDMAGNAVAAVPKMKLGNEYVTDFVIVVCRSVRLEVILVELEPPTARPFTKAGDFGRRLNGAVKQLTDWFAWLEPSENRDYFRRTLRESLHMDSWEYGAVSYRPLFEPFTEWYHAKIIIGRRAMMTQNDNRWRSAFLKSTGGRLEILPYDRLLFTERQLKTKGKEGIEAALREKWKKSYGTDV